MITKTFDGITPAIWEDIKQVFNTEAKPDNPIVDAQGHTNSHDIEFSWDYDGSSKLTTTIIHVPWYIVKLGHNYDQCMEQFSAWVDKAKNNQLTA